MTITLVSLFLQGNRPKEVIQMGSGAVDLVVAGQLVRVRGEYDDVAAMCRKRQLSADDGLREVLDVDGERVVFNIAAVGLIRKAEQRAARGAFGFSRALEGGGE